MNIIPPFRTCNIEVAHYNEFIYEFTTNIDTNNIHFALLKSNRKPYFGEIGSKYFKIRNRSLLLGLPVIKLIGTYITEKNVIKIRIYFSLIFWLGVILTAGFYISFKKLFPQNEISIIIIGSLIIFILLIFILITSSKKIKEIKRLCEASDKK